MNEEDDIERFEEERELELYREYRDVVPMFAFVVETERRFYLANSVQVTSKGARRAELGVVGRGGRPGGGGAGHAGCVRGEGARRPRVRRRVRGSHVVQAAE